MNIEECIKGRRSVRTYSSKRSIPKEIIYKIIEAGIWAPSGKNLQPWRFKIVTNREDIFKISECSKINKWLKYTPCIIVIYLDELKSYDLWKDVLSSGAVMQNMSLQANELGIGTCWLGEVVDNFCVINNILNISAETYRLVGAISLGYKINECAAGKRANISDFIL